MIYHQPIADIIRQRFSCRTYIDRPIDAEIQRQLKDAMSLLQVGPLGTPLRFELIAATPGDQDALKGLGTYGFIRGAKGFIVGAARRANRDLEDYGHTMEQIILLATDLGLGTCWLGGFFTKSRFANKIAATPDEQVPAVTAVGNIADPERARNSLLRRQVAAESRLPWERLFFQEGLTTPLARRDAGPYAIPLDMVRHGPSASNKQPWRIVRDGNLWHFYLRRTRGYGGGLLSTLVRIADVQRLDIGIAMCHFELAARELGLRGSWVIQEPSLERPDDLTEYRMSWASA